MGYAPAPVQVFLPQLFAVRPQNSPVLGLKIESFQLPAFSSSFAAGLSSLLAIVEIWVCLFLYKYEEHRAMVWGEIRDVGGMWLGQLLEWNGRHSEAMMLLLIFFWLKNLWRFLPLAEASLRYSKRCGYSKIVMIKERLGQSSLDSHDTKRKRYNNAGFIHLSWPEKIWEYGVPNK